MLRSAFLHASSDGGAPNSEHRAVSSPFAIAPFLRTGWNALREGLSAHREYERLRSHGFPHDTAVRAALSGDDPARAPRCGSCPHAGDAHSQASVESRTGGLSLLGGSRIGNLAFVP
jgi:hypothetical protein